MSILTPVFLIFLLVLVVVYYLAPQKYRWMALLLASLIFYCWGGRYKPLLYIGATAFSTWLAALMMDRVAKGSKEYLRLNTQLNPEEKKAVKTRTARTKKTIFLLTLLTNLLILGVIKYTNFTLGSMARVWNMVAGGQWTPAKIDFLVPLGISYYTFQSLGYLIDIYRGNYNAERNFGKYALFVTYFPQVLQGPIGRYDHLGPQLTAANPFDHKNLKHGATLMLWGYAKKMVIANRIAPLVAAVCKSPENYDGSLIVLAVVLYSFQLYTDFSGGIDMVTGASQLFGIQLAVNFKRPYFATSLGDFWRRWHVSLGGWMRDYIFYPFAMSKPMSKLSKRFREANKALSKALPAVLGNVLVFLVVGIWHGAEWRFVVWGLYNGLILGADVLLEPLYAAFRERFPKLKGNPLWHVFQILRTFAIVLVGDYFDCCKGVKGAFMMLKRSVADFHISAVSWETLEKLGLSMSGVWILLGALLVLGCVSLAQERGIQVRQWLDQRNVVIRWGLLYALIFTTIAFAATGTNALEGFMYEIF